jgi:E3 ubiquitin-protein ligase HUWE1
MSRASDRAKGPEESKDEIDQESMADEDDVEDGQDTAREETPDLYRNSSLGMYVYKTMIQWPVLIRVQVWRG